ncbi:MAG TPA: rhodanese-like domain-containing protein [Blastocatellia bacterium]|nr:rhodanese-like domain-containing protein [Blastocatellia bacterium]
MSANVQNAPEPIRITAEEVLKRMKRGEDVYFVDARNPVAWAEADTKLPGAVRVPADAVEQHLADIPRDRMVVAYCT